MASEKVSVEKRQIVLNENESFIALVKYLNQEKQVHVRLESAATMEEWVARIEHEPSSHLLESVYISSDEAMIQKAAINLPSATLVQEDENSKISFISSNVPLVTFAEYLWDDFGKKTKRKKQTETRRACFQWIEEDDESGCHVLIYWNEKLSMEFKLHFYKIKKTENELLYEKLMKEIKQVQQQETQIVEKITKTYEKVEKKICYLIRKMEKFEKEKIQFEKKMFEKFEKNDQKIQSLMKKIEKMENHEPHQPNIGEKKSEVDKMLDKIFSD